MDIDTQHYTPMINQKYEVCELICLKCLDRWVGVFPSANALKDMECQCGAKGSIIKTGQTLPELPDERMENDVRYQNMVKAYGKKEAMFKYMAFVRNNE